MKRWVYGAGVLLGVAVLWVMSGTEREKPLLSAALAAPLGPLEVAAMSHPDDPELTRKLAQAYLDARQPGLAIVFLASASPAARADARVQHVYARALLDEGHNGDALTADRGVVAACWALETGVRVIGCDDVLLASARRRVGILEALLAFGVDDTQAHPEVSFAAYKNATRDARVGLQ